MIFDSDVLIWFLRGDVRAAQSISSTADRAVSIISYLELMQGAKSRVEMQGIRRFLNGHRFRVLPITETVSHATAPLVEEFTLSCGSRMH